MHRSTRRGLLHPPGRAIVDRLGTASAIRAAALGVDAIAGPSASASSRGPLRDDGRFRPRARPHLRVQHSVRGVCRCCRWGGSTVWRPLGGGREYRHEGAVPHGRVGPRRPPHAIRAPAPGYVSEARWRPAPSVPLMPIRSCRYGRLYAVDTVDFALTIWSVSVCRLGKLLFSCLMVSPTAVA